jgi:hypothetical protein
MLTDRLLLHPQQYEESTPVIGREYTSDLQLADLLEAADSDKLIKDLAVLGQSALSSRACRPNSLTGF